VRTPYLRRCVTTICAGAMLLPGCAGSQPVGVPGASVVPVQGQGRSAAGSWMAPRASTEDLLYISSDTGASVYVYTYPQGELVGTLDVPGTSPTGECVDASGDVFITAGSLSGSGTVYEYVHGGTTPVEALSDPGLPNGCAVDSDTGNLAVANTLDDNNPYYRYRGDLAVYAKAHGRPKMYYSHDPATGDFFFCGYDDKANLYLSAEDAYHASDLLLRLPKGSNRFESISLNTNLYGEPSLQWRGTYLVASSSRQNQPMLVYRLRISGSTATVVGTSELESRRNDYNGQIWIQASTVIGFGVFKRGYQNAYFWPYPSGGRPQLALRKVAHTKQQLWGVTVSMAPLR
jgi:hypothetical protein